MTWKTIDEFDNYEINKRGEIRNKTTGRTKKPTLATNGYYYVTLYKNNKGKTLIVHRVLASAFIPNPNNLPTVNHKDGVKTNNELSNLEWTTYGENNKHAYDNGLKKVTPKMMNHAKNLHKALAESNPYGVNRNPVIAKFGGVEIHYHSVEHAAESLGFHRSSIDRVLKGKRKSAKGIVFKYKEENKNDE